MPGGVPHLWQSALEIARHACEIGLRLLRRDCGHFVAAHQLALSDKSSHAAKSLKDTMKGCS
jgi:hypothetical protein